MSLILDALKKSEAERLRGQTPSLLSPLPSTPGEKQTHTKSGLPWIIVLVLLIAILVIGFFYIKEKAIGPSSSAPIASDQPPAPKNVVEPIKKLTPTVPVPMSAPVPVEKPVPPIATVDQSVKVMPEVTLLPNETSATVNEQEAAPRMASLSEMSAEQRQQLPVLKLSMHVYSPEISKRFAIIDGQRVNEGSVIGSAVVEQIRQDGVVLLVQGQSYLLPRP
jgi:general secretion pathway protein B